MNEDLPYYVDLLKKYVRSKAGVSALSPGDCRRIVLDVQKTTGKQVSETTLKRFFGFASRKYNFSRFTVNALCEYVGFNGWDAFIQALEGMSQEEITIQSTHWRNLRHKASVISDITLKTIRHRCGIPFELTIPRQFAETDFAHFIQSPYRLTAFIAPPGAGKSVLLAHLTEKFFNDPSSPYHNSIVWFVNAGIISSLGNYGFQLDDWFNEQMGLVGEVSFREYFQKHPEEVNGKVFLILDGFDEYIFNNGQLGKLFSNITDLICYNDNLSWMKLVIAVRSTTWMMLEEQLNSSEYLKRSWYPGLYFRKETHSNIPPLSNDEVGALLTQIEGRPVTVDRLPARLLSQLRSTFYMQLYYQLREKEKDFGYTRRHTAYELVSEFVLKKIYLTKRSTEKLVLINRFIRLSGEGQVEKNQLLQEIIRYPEAYEELISNGIWMEENRSDTMRHREVIRFVYDNLFEYFVAQDLIQRHQQQFSRSLFREVEREYGRSPLKLVLLQWIVRHAARSGEFAAIGELFRTGLSPAEKHQLLLFTGDLLSQERPAGQEQDIAQGHLMRISQLCPGALLLDFDVAVAGYEGALLSLAAFSSFPEDRSELYCVLALNALARLDKEKLLYYLRLLKQHAASEPLRLQYPISPLKCLQFLAGYYTQAGQPAEHEILSAIAHFIQQPPAQLRGKQMNGSQALSYRLALMVYVLVRPPAEVIRFIAAIRELHPYLFSHRDDTGISLFLLVELGQAYMRLKQYKNARRIHRHLQRRYALRGETYFTASQLIWMHLLDSLLLQHDGQFRKAEALRSKAWQLAGRAGLPLVKLYAGIWLVEGYKRQDDFEKVAHYMREMALLMKKPGFALEERLMDRLAEAS
ncbi:hypothetical protein [Compostibacter hankyongensis]|uniref:NACHT domain-containing protein n=1 Tax=Compostibacter hankyongensis TaxID=1007089 RepID=A0ABP8G156_9BACT